MPQITLAVTDAARNQANKTAADNQRQIAIKDASAELQERLKATHKGNKHSILIGGLIELIAGDTDAIWLSHQTGDVQRQDFNCLYELLARHVDQRLQITW